MKRNLKLFLLLGIPLIPIAIKAMDAEPMEIKDKSKNSQNNMVGSTSSSFNPMLFDISDVQPSYNKKQEEELFPNDTKFFLEKKQAREAQEARLSEDRKSADKARKAAIEAKKAEKDLQDKKKREDRQTTHIKKELAELRFKEINESLNKYRSIREANSAKKTQRSKSVKRPLEEDEKRKDRPSKRQRTDNAAELNGKKQLRFLHNNCKGELKNDLNGNIEDYLNNAQQKIVIQMDQIGIDFAFLLADIKAKKKIDIQLIIKTERSPLNRLPWTDKSLNNFNHNKHYREYHYEHSALYHKNYKESLEDQEKNNNEYDQRHGKAYDPSKSENSMNGEHYISNEYNENRTGHADFVERCNHFENRYKKLLEDLFSNNNFDKLNFVKNFNAKASDFTKKFQQLLIDFYGVYNIEHQEQIIQNINHECATYLEAQAKLFDILNILIFANIDTKFIKPIDDKNRKLRMHDKIIVIDDNVVITGSANMTFSGTQNNLESNIAIEDRNIAQQYNDYLENCLKIYKTESYSEFSKKCNEYKNAKLMYSLYMNDENEQPCLRKTTSRTNTTFKNIEQEEDNKVEVRFSAIDKFIRNEITKAQSSIKMQLYFLGDIQFIILLINQLKENDTLKVEINLDKKQAENPKLFFTNKQHQKVSLEGILIEKLKEKRADCEGRLTVNYLEKANAAVHDKLIVIDEKITILGSANISQGVAQGQNLENVIKIVDANFAQEVTKYMENCRNDYSNSKGKFISPSIEL